MSLLSSAIKRNSVAFNQIIENMLEHSRKIEAGKLFDCDLSKVKEDSYNEELRKILIGVIDD